MENAEIAAPHFFSDWRRTPAVFEVRFHTGHWPLRHRKPMSQLHTGKGVHEILGRRLRFRLCYTLRHLLSFRGKWVLAEGSCFPGLAPLPGILARAPRQDHRLPPR